MNGPTRKRIIGIACAAVLFGNAVGIMPVLPAAADSANTSISSSETETELTAVMITLDGDPAIVHAADAEDLTLSAAQSASERAGRQQAQVLKKLREKYPALQVEQQFSTLVNGFSCEMPNKLIPYAESLAGVTNVTVSRKFEIKPEMATAPSVGEIPAYYDETGCKGEGQVVAIIDTELNLNHPMFAALPDDIDIKLTQADVEEIADTIGFHCSESWRKGYYNSKIPFAADYLEGDPLSVGDENGSWYHGSHVAGIAAGNPFETDDGKLISGIAPNAQIVFMAVDQVMGPTALVAAIEDAVKLQADVINISMGLDEQVFDEYQILTDAINAAEAAGITVCLSAGNADIGSEYYGQERPADNPDRSCLSGFVTENERALAVAAADNPFTIQLHTLTHNGIQMPYTGCVASQSDPEAFLGDQFPGQELEYEYCGLGYPDEFEGKDLTGKLALIDRGVLDFSTKADNAKQAGAVGVIIIQNKPFNYMLMQNSSEILCAMISQENGSVLKDAEVKKVSFTDEMVPFTTPLDVSTYSSWGVHNSLELRPDIMGIGTNVKSAANSGNGTGIMSGTSMASPYIAGCAAILDEYLDKTGCTLTGSERQKLIRNLLMTSAAPMRKDDLCVTPRRQGAGLVSMNNAAHDKVILTGAEGESKLSLRDELGSHFSFAVTATNISDEDVVFSSAHIELTTDQTKYNTDTGEYILTEEQQALSCTADLQELNVIPAGSAKTVNVTVTLDAAQTASLNKIFTRGYFIEGYLMLEDAENCCDISVPMLGFSKSYADLPIFTDTCKTVVNRSCMQGLVYSPSYFELTKRKMEIEWPKGPGTIQLSLKDEPGPPDEEQLKAYWDFQTLLLKLIDSLQNFDDTIIISPNHDHVADIPGIIIRNNHACVVSGAELFDKDGKRAAIGFDAIPIARDPNETFGFAVYPNQQLYDLPEGEYTMRVTAGMTKEALKTHPQILETKVIIDKTDPKLKSELTEKNGRKILKLTAADEHLDSLVVLGIGSGTPVNPSAYERICTDEMKPVYNFCGYATDAYDGQISYDSVIAGKLTQGEITEDTYNSDPIFRERKEQASMLMKSFLGEDVDDWLSQYDYSEVIKAETDENGVFSIEYDVTDMEAYHFFIMDNAFNSDYVEYYGETILPKSVPSGIYKGEHGLYEFTEDTLRFYPFAFGVKPTTYHYSFDMQWHDKSSVYLKLNGDFEDSLTEAHCNLYSRLSDTEFILLNTADNSGFRKAFGFPSKNDEKLELTDLTSADDYFAIDAYKLENDCIPSFMKEYTKRGVSKIIDYEIAPDAVVTYTCLSNHFGSGGVIESRITVDLKTGIGTLENGDTIDFLKYDTIQDGDFNCDGQTDVSDAVLLARFVAEDSDVNVTKQGKKNADCNRNGQPDQDDVILILQAIAKIIRM